MAMEFYEEDCPGCKPAILDVDMKTVLDDSHPLMQKMLSIWKGCSRGEKESYHRVMCKNSRDKEDMKTVQSILNRLQSVSYE